MSLDSDGRVINDEPISQTIGDPQQTPIYPHVPHTTPTSTVSNSNSSHSIIIGWCVLGIIISAILALLAFPICEDIIGSNYTTLVLSGPVATVIGLSLLGIIFKSEDYIGFSLFLSLAGSVVWILISIFNSSTWPYSFYIIGSAGSIFICNFLGMSGS